eukprot:NODE_1762_length_1616_cov_108.235767_g1676_i0.p1 GENE.NODE_1762_length_1616_cov_108.235767_g1676_i0~~NODE_1762_length_1616_cov_108.235767_g1676_i0.p1  ORF type:complete len:438 (+),score=91.54 NODE_1762_length_1616_cov_108.235767_g1676_i0:56-1315(+)
MAARSALGGHRPHRMSVMDSDPLFGDREGMVDQHASVAAELEILKRRHEALRRLVATDNALDEVMRENTHLQARVKELEEQMHEMKVMKTQAGRDRRATNVNVQLENDSLMDTVADLRAQLEGLRAIQQTNAGSSVCMVCAARGVSKMSEERVTHRYIQTEMSMEVGELAETILQLRKELQTLKSQHEQELWHARNSQEMVQEMARRLHTEQKHWEVECVQYACKVDQLQEQAAQAKAELALLRQQHPDSRTGGFVSVKRDSHTQFPTVEEGTLDALQGHYARSEEEKRRWEQECARLQSANSQLRAYVDKIAAGKRYGSPRSPPSSVLTPSYSTQKVLDPSDAAAQLQQRPTEPSSPLTNRGAKAPTAQEYGYPGGRDHSDDVADHRVREHLRQLQSAFVERNTKMAALRSSLQQELS